MNLPKSLPILLPNPGRDIALKELPEDAEVVVYIAPQKDHQYAPELRAGTAQKGKVDFGDQIGSRRLKVGDCLSVLCTLGNREASIAFDIQDPRKTELLILNRNVAPITEFTR